MPAAVGLGGGDVGGGGGEGQEGAGSRSASAGSLRTSNSAPSRSWPSSSSASSSAHGCAARDRGHLLERTASTSAFHSRVLSPVATSDARRPPTSARQRGGPWPPCLRAAASSHGRLGLGAGMPIFRRIIASARIPGETHVESSSRLSRPSRLASLSTPIARMQTERSASLRRGGAARRRPALQLHGGRDQARVQRSCQQEHS